MYNDLELKYLQVCSDPDILQHILENKLFEDDNKLNRYISNVKKEIKISFDPYKFIVNYIENLDEYLTESKSLDIIKVCHCYITIGYPCKLKISSFDSNFCKSLVNSPRVCFITSMTLPMYKYHGQKMVESLYYKTKELNRVIKVYTEGFEEFHEHIHYINIDNDKWLNDWLTNFKYLIPLEYGGTNSNYMRNFNYNASKWIKKVASIKLARNLNNFDYLIWIDCDSKIHININYELISESFKDCNVFYHHGIKREKKQYGIETGVIGFDKIGLNIIDRWTTYFQTGNFEKLRRWDDGFVLRHIINKIKIKKDVSILIKDLTPDDANWLYPLRSSIWNPYIEHIKGSHTRKKVYKMNNTAFLDKTNESNENLNTYTSNNEILILTSFNYKLYEEYAHQFLKSMNFDFDLYICTEDITLKPNIYKMIKKENVSFIDLDNDNDMNSFINRNSCRTFEDYKYDGVRFCYKVYSLTYVAEMLQMLNKYKYLIWIDADVVFRKHKLTKTLINEILPSDSMMAYLGRNGKFKNYSECGFMVFNLEHPKCFDYFKEMRKMYNEDLIYKEKEYHDSYIWDIIRKKFEKEYDVKNMCIKNDGKYHLSKGNVMLHSILNKYILHPKGKFKGELGKLMRFERKNAMFK